MTLDIIVWLKQPFLILPMVPQEIFVHKVVNVLKVLKIILNANQAITSRELALINAKFVLLATIAKMRVNLIHFNARMASVQLDLSLHLFVKMELMVLNHLRN